VRVTDRTGAFRVEGLEPGVHDLIAMATDGRTAKVRGISLAEGEDKAGLRLVAEGGIVVKGRAVDAESGQPIPSVRVQIELAGNNGFTLTDTSGAFQLDNVPALPRLRAVQATGATTWRCAWSRRRSRGRRTSASSR
jgi:hypothetical protein